MVDPRSRRSTPHSFESHSNRFQSRTTQSHFLWWSPTQLFCIVEVVADLVRRTFERERSREREILLPLIHRSHFRPTPNIRWFPSTQSVWHCLHRTTTLLLPLKSRCSQNARLSLPPPRHRHLPLPSWEDMRIACGKHQYQYHIHTTRRRMRQRHPLIRIHPVVVP